MRDFLQDDAIRNRDFSRSRSPLTFIDLCNTLTLVLHGDKNERVPQTKGPSWRRGLKLLGIEIERVFYPGGGHLLTPRDHQLNANGENPKGLMAD